MKSKGKINRDLMRSELEASLAAKNGLLDRRLFMKGGLLAGSIAVFAKPGRVDDTSTEAAINYEAPVFDVQSASQSIGAFLPDSMLSLIHI